MLGAAGQDSDADDPDPENVVLDAVQLKARRSRAVAVLGVRALWRGYWLV